MKYVIKITLPVVLTERLQYLLMGLEAVGEVSVDQKDNNYVIETANLSAAKVIRDNFAQYITN